MEDSTVLNIVYENKGKSIAIGHLTYEQLIRRVIHTFKLNLKNHYHLSYRDNEGDFVTVQTEKEFHIFINSSSRKKLCLE